MSTTSSTFGIPDTLNGFPVYGASVIGSLGSGSVQQFGTDPNGLPVYFLVLGGTQTYIVSLNNPSSVTQTLSHPLMKGSEQGFAQSAGITVEVSGGIDLQAINFGASVSATGTLGFTQAFSKQTTFTVQVNVPPGKTTAIFEGAVIVQYFTLYQLFKDGSMCYWVVPQQKDVIETGAYSVYETDLDTAHAAALLAQAGI